MSSMQWQLLAAFFLIVTAVLLVLIQLERFEKRRRAMAMSSLAVFAVGGFLVYYLEEIRDFVWEGRSTYAVRQGNPREGMWSSRSGNGGRAIARRGQATGDGREPSGAEVEETALGPNAGKGKFRTYTSIIRDCRDCPDLVIVEADMERDGVRSFAVGRFELTAGQYAAFLRETRYPVATSCEAARDGMRRVTFMDLAYAGGAMHPAACLSPKDVTAYLAWLSEKTGRAYRLPTAAEWQFAARSGGTVPVAVGTTMLQNVSVETAAGVNAVGQSRSNGWGIHDLDGNVSELVADCAAGGAVGCGTIAIGRSWMAPVAFDAQRAVADGKATVDIGFRVARDLGARKAR